MDTLHEESYEITPLIPRTTGIGTVVRDTRQTYEKKLALYFILATIVFERIAFYTLADNIVFTLHSNDTLKWDLSNSSTASFIFFGTRYIFTLIFAALCDAKLGRTKTIIIGFALYVVGYTLIIINSNKKISFCHFPIDKSHAASSIFYEPCASWFLPTLICTAIAAGTVQSNIAVFAAEQIQELKMISRYADKYMIAMSIGDIISLLAIPYIQKNSDYYYIGYIFAATMLIISIAFFIIGCRYCIHVKPYDTVITKCIPVIINAFHTWRQYNKNKHTITSTNINEREDLTSIDERPSSFLDFAKVVNYGKFNDRIVDDVKSIQSPLIVFGLLIPYWLIYSQINSTFPQQGEKMKLPYQTMPIIWMTLAEPVTIIISIFIVDIFIYKYLDTWKKEIVIAIKFVIGMCFACISMFSAGIVEIFRQKGCIGDDTSSLSIYFQLIQNIFIGFSEFAIVASFEFAYFSAPRSAQSLFMSFRFSAAGIASFIGIGFSKNFLQPANEDSDSNCLGHGESWRYYIYFFILVGFQLLFIIIFIICHKKFRIIKLNVQQMDTLY